MDLDLQGSSSSLDLIILHDGAVIDYGNSV